MSTLSSSYSSRLSSVYFTSHSFHLCSLFFYFYLCFIFFFFFFFFFSSRRRHTRCGRDWSSDVCSSDLTEFDLHQTGYSFRKFTEYNATTEGTLSNSETNFIVIRYADVLLMYAEALNELEGPVQGVYDAINEVRNRPSVEMPDIPAGLTKEQMREAVRLERRIELAGESSYFFDIRRWGIIDEVMPGPIYNYEREIIETREFNPARDILFPIPYTEIDLNPALQQNPGY